MRAEDRPIQPADAAVGVHLWVERSPVTAFDFAVEKVLNIEGVHDQGDAVGGDTWYGISRKAHQDIIPWPPSREQAITIYRTSYWDLVRGDEMPPPIALVVFDAAVQHGVRDAIRFLQEALNYMAGARLTVDGDLGPLTLAAVRGALPSRVAAEILARRGIYYPTLPNWEDNKLGWSRRLFTVHRAALTI